MSEFIPAGSPCFPIESAIEHPFVVGDIVTRMGADEQEVIGNHPPQVLRQWSLNRRRRRRLFF